MPTTDEVYAYVLRLHKLPNAARQKLREEVEGIKESLRQEDHALFDQDREAWFEHHEKNAPVVASWHWVWCIVATATATMPNAILPDIWEKAVHMLEIISWASESDLRIKRLEGGVEAWEVWTPFFGTVASSSKDISGVLARNGAGLWAATVNAYPPEGDPSYRFPSPQDAWEWYTRA